MTLNDPLAVALSNIWNAEKVGKLECRINPSSKTILAVLDIMKLHNYITNVKVEKNNTGNTIKEIPTSKEYGFIICFDK